MTDQGPVRLGIVGLGEAGQRQIQAAREVPEAIEVVALVDPDAERLAGAAGTVGIERTATDLDELLADPGIDAVSICTSPDRHEPLAREAIAAGVHVLVEKPMATTVAAADRMIEAADGAGVTLYVAEHHPYEERLDLLREIIRTGDPIGELTFAACTAGSRAGHPADASSAAQPGGPAADEAGTWLLEGVNTVSALRYVLGEVVRVYMLEHRTSSFAQPGLEATMAGTVELESGGVVSLVQTAETDLLPRLSGFRLYGDRGVVIGREHSYDVFVGDPREGDQPATVPYPPQELSAHALELAAFAETVRGGLPGHTTGRSERRTLAVIEAGYESARTRQPVDLRERYPHIW